MQEFLLTIVSILVWYQIGLVGSVIAMSSSRYLSWTDKEDRCVAYVMALLGPINLIAGAIFAIFYSDKE